MMKYRLAYNYIRENYKIFPTRVHMISIITAFEFFAAARN